MVSGGEGGGGFREPPIVLRRFTELQLSLSGRYQRKRRRKTSRFTSATEGGDSAWSLGLDLPGGRDKPPAGVGAAAEPNPFDALKPFWEYRLIFRYFTLVRIPCLSELVANLFAVL